jgi:hypothetical protein
MIYIYSYNVCASGLALQGDRLYNGGHRGVDPYSVHFVGDYTQVSFDTVLGLF